MYDPSPVTAGHRHAESRGKGSDGGGDDGLGGRGRGRMERTQKQKNSLRRTEFECRQSPPTLMPLSLEAVLALAFGFSPMSRYPLTFGLKLAWDLDLALAWDLDLEVA